MTNVKLLTQNKLLPAKLLRSCGQGNIFTPVCHSVHGGRVGGIPQGTEADPPPDLAHHLPRTRHTTPPRTWHTTPPPPGPDTPPPPQPDTPPPLTRHTPPGADTTPPDQAPIPPPPGKQTPAYGLRAAGTHPTGMHSC